MERPPQFTVEPPSNLVGGFALDVPAPQEQLDVVLADGRVALDLGVEHGLGVRGLVALVVAPAPVAHDVDDDVLGELGAIVGGYVYGSHDRLGIVAVCVENRSLNALRDVRAVVGRTQIRGAGGETDLVVHD